MEQFRVEPQYLKGYAEQVRRNANFVDQTRSYLAANGAKTDKMTGFLLSPVVAGYHKVLAWQLELLETMNRKLFDSAAALDKAADAYAHTDQNTATNLDKTYPAPQQSSPGSGGMRPE
jgi:uncharacterized protein YukE